jgi:uncharacterized damage-inducible protein DinB
MNKFLFFLLLATSLQLSAADNPDLQWKSTSLNEATIKHIQQAKFQYMTCITKEITKKEYVKIDTRAATDKILKQCEPSLGEVKKVFAEEKVPDNITQRYLKSTRTQTARKVLEHMIISAAKK